MEEYHVHVVHLKRLKNVFTARYVLEELNPSSEVKMRKNLKSIVSLVAQVLKYNMERRIFSYHYFGQKIARKLLNESDFYCS